MQLGSITFRDFEVEAGIDFGGRQRLAVHRLPNGTRIVDVLGPDPANIIFGGVFSGQDAVTRAQELDALRKSGAQVILSWNSFQYAVILSEFSADFQARNWVPYRAACTVVEDDTPVAESGDSDLTPSALASAASALTAAAIPGCVLDAAVLPLSPDGTPPGRSDDLLAEIAARIEICTSALNAASVALGQDANGALLQVEEALSQLSALMVVRAYGGVGVITRGAAGNA
jgi:hypothetical protein